MKMPQRSGFVSIFVCFLTLTAAAPAGADVPRLIHYQGKFLNATGQFIAGPVDLRVRLYSDPVAAGPVLFDETHNAVSLAKGLCSILIGSNTGGGVPDAALDAAEVYLGLAVDGAAELTPRTRLATAPYTVKSRSAERLVRPDTHDAAVTVESSGDVNVQGDGTTLILPRKTSSGDPSGGLTNGMMYYNMDSNKLRARQNGAWLDVIGGGSGSDPCVLPEEPWQYHGVINSDVPTSGGITGTPVDISDVTKEYFLWGTSLTTDFTIGSNPPIAVTTVDTEGGAITEILRIQDASGTWRSNSIATGTSNIIRKGAQYDSASPTSAIVSAQILSTGPIEAQLHTDGFVRLSDLNATRAASLVVLRRTPAGPYGEACDPTPSPWSVTGVANSGVSDSGTFGNIDIRNVTKTYSLFGTSLTSDFSISSSPPFAFVRTSSVSTPTPFTNVRRVQDASGTWRSSSIATSTSSIIRPGAQYNAASPTTALLSAQILSTGPIEAQVHTDGFVKLSDLNATRAASLVVFERTP